MGDVIEIRQIENIEAFRLCASIAHARWSPERFDTEALIAGMMEYADIRGFNDSQILRDGLREIALSATCLPKTIWSWLLRRRCVLGTYDLHPRLEGVLSPGQVTAVREATEKKLDEILTRNRRRS